MGEGVYVGIDVGGTKVLAGIVDNRGRILRTAQRATPGRRVEVATLEDALTDAVRAVTEDARVRGVGLAAAGFVDAAGERVMFARSEEHTSEIQSLMRIPYSVFCFKKKRHKP